MAWGDRGGHIRLRGNRCPSPRTMRWSPPFTVCPCVLFVSFATPFPFVDGNHVPSPLPFCDSYFYFCPNLRRAPQLKVGQQSLPLGEGFVRPPKVTARPSAYGTVVPGRQRHLSSTNTTTSTAMLFCFSYGQLRSIISVSGSTETLFSCKQFCHYKLSLVRKIGV